MSKKLTKDQEAKLQEYYDEYYKIALLTGPCDRAAAEDGIIKYYKYLGKQPPAFEWYDSTQQGAEVAAKKYFKKKKVNKDDINKILQSAVNGSFEAYWVAFYSFITEVLGEPKNEMVEISKQLVRNTGVHWLMDDVAIMCERPTEIHVKDDMLHNADGPAIKYKDGTSKFIYKNKKYDSMMEMMLETTFGGKNE